MDANDNPDLGNDMSHCHTLHQIQRLEEIFRQCPHPDETRRTRIARGLGLDLTQVTSWFHNKRNQRKALHHPAENNAARTEYHRVCNEIQANIEQEMSMEATSSTRRPISHYLSMAADTTERFLELIYQQSERFSVDPDIVHMISQNMKAAKRSICIKHTDIKGILEHVTRAYKELVAISTDIKPFWVKSPTHRGYVLNHKEYSKLFRKSSHVSRTSFQIESSRDSAVVPLKALDLAGMFLDMNQWAGLFPTIVKKAKILHSLDTGNPDSTLHIINGRMHILSPLVQPREFTFLRYCVRQSPDTWFIVDVTYDFLIKTQGMSHMQSWRFPSGVKIQSLPDSKSEVTWVEHVNVNRQLIHPLYSHLLSTSHGYGATRWLCTLQRMSERSQYSEISRSTSSHVLEAGRENFMALSLRMIRDFCSIFEDGRYLSGSSNPEVKISVRNDNEPGQYHGMIVAASSSIRLPLTVENLFNFLRDESKRPKWDVMNDRSSVNAIAHFSTGPHPGDSISLLQLLKEEDACLLQESSIDPVGALVIFTLVSLPKIMEIANGADTNSIPILPCGFLISSDGNGSDGASGSLLTLAIQWLELDNTESTQKAVADHLDNTLTAIIHDITKVLD